MWNKVSFQEARRTPPPVTTLPARGGWFVNEPMFLAANWARLMSCQLFVRVSDQHESLSCFCHWAHFILAFECYISFLSLIFVISVNTVKVMIFINSGGESSTNSSPEGRNEDRNSRGRSSRGENTLSPTISNQGGISGREIRWLASGHPFLLNVLKCTQIPNLSVLRFLVTALWKEHNLQFWLFFTTALCELYKLVNYNTRAKQLCGFFNNC